MIEYNDKKAQEINDVVLEKGKQLIKLQNEINELREQYFFYKKSNEPWIDAILPEDEERWWGSEAEFLKEGGDESKEGDAFLGIIHRVFDKGYLLEVLPEYNWNKKEKKTIMVSNRSILGICEIKDKKNPKAKRNERRT